MSPSTAIWTSAFVFALQSWNLRLTIRTGAGIVADSDPQSELEPEQSRRHDPRLQLLQTAQQTQTLTSDL